MISVRPFIESFRESRFHHRPFILGEPVRVGEQGWRMWRCDVRIDDALDGTPQWYRGVLMADEEVFIERGDRDVRRKPRQQIVGFVGYDGKTHAQRDIVAGLRLAWCGENRAVDKAPTCAPLIANPKAPLCMDCVRAIEAEIGGEKS